MYLPLRRFFLVPVVLATAPRSLHHSRRPSTDVRSGSPNGASGGENITKIGRFENHYVFLRKLMLDERALQNEERAARVIIRRWDIATFMQMQPNGWTCTQ